MAKKNKDTFFSPLGLKIYDAFIEEEGDGYDKDTLISAINRFLSTRSNVKLYKDNVRDKTLLDEGRLFGSIDNTIAYLTELKKEGYVEIEQEWYSYEENGFNAVKIREETDEEHLSRLVSKVEKVYRQMEKELDEKAIKRKKIAEYEKKIEELKKAL